MKPLTTETAWTIGGTLLVLAALGGMYLMIFVRSAVAELPLVTKSYNVGVIQSDLKVRDEDNVFIKASQLRKPAVSPEDSGNYESSDLGKTNLNELGR